MRLANGSYDVNCELTLTVKDGELVSIGSPYKSNPKSEIMRQLNYRIDELESELGELVALRDIIKESDLLEQGNAS